MLAHGVARRYWLGLSRQFLASLTLAMLLSGGRTSSSQIFRVGYFINVWTTFFEYVSLLHHLIDALWLYLPFVVLRLTCGYLKIVFHLLICFAQLF